MVLIWKLMMLQCLLWVVCWCICCLDAFAFVVVVALFVVVVEVCIILDVGADDADDDDDDGGGHRKRILVLLGGLWPHSNPMPTGLGLILAYFLATCQLFVLFFVVVAQFFSFVCSVALLKHLTALECCFFLTSPNDCTPILLNTKSIY